MKFTNRSLDRIAKHHTKVLVFDCEFWHIHGSEGYAPAHRLPNQYVIPREIGGLYFEKEDEWVYKGSFFVTLEPPRGTDVSVVSAEYATVTERTASKLRALESKLTVPWNHAFKATLSPEEQSIRTESLAIYRADPAIKKAHVPPGWYLKFMHAYANSMVIMKGSADLDALQNASKLYGFKYKHPERFDIGFWNPESRRICGTAKLSETYECIVPKLSAETKKLADELPSGKIHSPIADSVQTFIIALYIKQT